MLCEAYGWNILPHELDEIDIASLKHPLFLLRVFRSEQRAGVDLDSLSDDDIRLLNLTVALRRAEP